MFPTQGLARFGQLSQRSLNSSFRGAIDQLCIWRVVGVYHKELLFTTSQQSVDIDLSVKDPNHSTRAGIRNVVFHAGAIAKDNDNFIFGV